MSAKQILLHFQNEPGKLWPIADILKFARKPKKEVNAELYKLQRQKLVERVQVSPPVWKLVSNPAAGFSDSHAGDSQNESETSQSAPTGVSTRTRSRGNTSSGDPELQQRILDVLRHHDCPLKPNIIAKGIGLHRTQVNQTLYLMESRGFIMKAKDQPPEWALVPHFLSSGSSSDENDPRAGGAECMHMEEKVTEDDCMVDRGPDTDLSPGMSMPIPIAEEDEQMLLDGGGGPVDYFGATATPGQISQEPSTDMDTSVSHPDLTSSNMCKDSSVNDETLAELKRLVEESIPARDEISEETTDPGVCTQDLEVKEEVTMELSSDESKSEVVQNSLENASDDAMKETGSHLEKTNEETECGVAGNHLEMETGETDMTEECVNKKQRITEDNAVLLAMQKPRPEIKREKEFEVPTEAGMLPFAKKTSPPPTSMPLAGLGRGRGRPDATLPVSSVAPSVSKPSSGFSRPLPPHELLRIRGELPESAEKTFSESLHGGSPQTLAATPGVGRGRAISQRQLGIPGVQVPQFSSSGECVGNLWPQNAGRGIPVVTGRGRCAAVFPNAQQPIVRPAPGSGMGQSGGKTPPSPADLIRKETSENSASARNGVKSSPNTATLANTNVNKPESIPSKPVAQPVVKPVTTSSSSFKLPMSPLDLIQTTDTWGQGVTPSPKIQKEKSPEVLAQNAFLSALNVPSDNGNSQSQSGNNFGNKSQNFGSSFGSGSNYGSNGNSNFGSANSFGSNQFGRPSTRPALGLSSAPVAQSPALSTKLTGLTQNDMHSSGSSSSSFSSESFNMLNKNPISALSEYAQTRKLQLEIKIVGESGPAHKKRFQMAAFVGKQRFPAVCGTNKKDCRKDAADVALRALMADGKFQSPSEKSNTAKIPVASGPTTHFDKMASLSHNAFNTLAARIAENLSGRKVLAALIMKKGPSDGGSVISMGTGNRCITGPQMSLEGHTVNDSHAEIITRRGFIRFLYKHLETDQLGTPESLFEPSPSGKLKIKDGITFHLYISTAPCGDGALFSPRDADGAQVKEGENKVEHTPTFTTAVQGILRTKIEGGEGTIPLESGFVAQTWDGILRGERLRTMSCSDKLCRWNILGMQGALLTHFLDPIYLETLTLGYLYDHGQLSRSLCCRLSKGEPPIDELLPQYYKLNHPHIGRVTVYEGQRGTEKTKAVSLNWCAGDTGAEVVDGTLGQVIEKTRSNVISRVAKKNLWDSFKTLCRKYNKSELLEADHYYAAKQGATDFQQVKKIMIERFRKNKLGPWVQKPMEEKMFV